MSKRPTKTELRTIMKQLEATALAATFIPPGKGNDEHWYIGWREDGSAAAINVRGLRDIARAYSTLKALIKRM